jgi:CAF1 family ribonuclease
VVLNPSSIQFLQQHVSVANFDMNTWTRQGIPYCTVPYANTCLAKFQMAHSTSSTTTTTSTTTTAGSAVPTTPTTNSHHHNSNSNNSKTKRHTPQRRLESTRPKDKNFHARAMSSLREWLDAAIPPPLPAGPIVHPHHHHHPGRGGEQPDDRGGLPPPPPIVQVVGGGDHGAFWRRQPAVAVNVADNADAAFAPNNNIDNGAMGAADDDDAVMGLEDGDGAAVAAPPAAEMEGIIVDFLPLLPPPPPDDSEGVSLVLPACNSFLRRALYESIEWEYPHLIVESEPPPALPRSGRGWRTTPSSGSSTTRRRRKQWIPQ